MSPCHTSSKCMVSSSLDYRYCNLLLIGITKSNMQKLHGVQNSLAKAITDMSKYVHIPSVQQRISFISGLWIIEKLTTILKISPIPQIAHSSTRSCDCLSQVVPKLEVCWWMNFLVVGSKYRDSLPASVSFALSLVFCQS